MRGQVLLAIWGVWSAAFGLTAARGCDGAVSFDEALGYTLTVYDYRPETLAFMKERHLQGGGLTWKALVRASLELYSPETLERIRFDDEADVVLIRSVSQEAMETTLGFVKRLMDDLAFRRMCVAEARAGGYLE